MWKCGMKYAVLETNHPTSPPLPLWKISLSTIVSSTKGSYNKELQRFRVHNSTTQSSIQEVAQSQLSFYKALSDLETTNTLFFITSYRIDINRSSRSMWE